MGRRSLARREWPARPAQRAGRSQPRAEAAGRCPGWRDDNAVRPERPRDRWAGQSFGEKFSRPFRPPGWGALFHLGIGMWRQAWLGFSLLVGPVASLTDEMPVVYMSDNPSEL